MRKDEIFQVHRIRITGHRFRTGGHLADDVPLELAHSCFVSRSGDHVLANGWIVHPGQSPVGRFFTQVPQALLQVRRSLAQEILRQIPGSGQRTRGQPRSITEHELRARAQTVREHKGTREDYPSCLCFLAPSCSFRALWPSAPGFINILFFSHKLF